MPVTALAPQASASANSATFARGNGHVIGTLGHVKRSVRGGALCRSTPLPHGSVTSHSISAPLGHALFNESAHAANRMTVPCGIDAAKRTVNDAVPLQPRGERIGPEKLRVRVASRRRRRIGSRRVLATTWGGRIPRPARRQGDEPENPPPPGARPTMTRRSPAPPGRPRQNVIRRQWTAHGLPRCGGPERRTIGLPDALPLGLHS